MSVPSQGGSPQELARVEGQTVYSTGSWGPDGDLVFTVFAGVRGFPQGRTASLFRLFPDGKLEQLTEEESGRPHRHPYHLQGGRYLLFNSDLRLMAVDLESGATHAVLEDATNPRYASTGHLIVFAPSTQQLLAVPFDLETATVRGDPTLLDRIYAGPSATGGFDVSRDGTLIFAPDLGPGAHLGSLFQLIAVDRRGEVESLKAEENSWAEPRFSPDGGRVLVRRIETPICSLWSYDLRRRVMTRVSFDRDTHSRLWYPSGDAVVFGAGDDTGEGLYLLSADGGGTPQALYEPPVPTGSNPIPGRFLRDGET